MCDNDDDWIQLRVGGTTFETTRSTLCAREPQSMLARWFTPREEGGLWPMLRSSDGYIRIDRSGKYFDVVLNYLRHGKLILDASMCVDGVRQEADYFNMPELLVLCDEYEKKLRKKADEAPMTRREVIALIAAVPASYSSNSLVDHGSTSDSVPRLRLQGVNLAGCDLSFLDLRRVNFRHADLSGANLQCANVSECDFTKANMKGANLDRATLRRVNMSCACLENASMRECNFEDPCEQPAYLELANLKGADLEGARMFKAELRVASLKGAKLRFCDLQRATLAGADLEFCDLTGSDLQEANLRGANFRNAIIEAMRTPLHMTQTVQPHSG